MSTASDSILRSSRCAILCPSNLFPYFNLCKPALSAEIHLPKRSLQKQHFVGNGMPELGAALHTLVIESWPPVPRVNEQAMTA